MSWQKGSERVDGNFRRLLLSFLHKIWNKEFSHKKIETLTSFVTKLANIHKQ